MDRRYLEAGRVEADAAAPHFVEPGHCLWCNRPLTGKATKYCSLKEFDQEKYRHYSTSPCYISFFHYFYHRPAYQRATFIRDDFICRKCGIRPMREDKPWLPDLSEIHCDHIIPISRGGPRTLDNLQTLCKKCNLAKGDKIEVQTAVGVSGRRDMFQLPLLEPDKV